MKSRGLPVLLPARAERFPQGFRASADAAVRPDGRIELVSVSFVANPADPKARVHRECKACGASFPGSHPDNGCEMADIFDTHES